MTSLPTQTEDAYEGKTKCNSCQHSQHKHRFGKDICLHMNCSCMSFASSGGLK